MSLVDSRSEELLRAALGEEANPEAPQSRVEKILASIAGEEVQLDEPQSRVEVLLKALAENGGGGSGGLEYETGEWTAPNAYTKRGTIPFANEHNKPPAFAGWIATSGYLTSSSDCIYSFAISYDLLLGTRFDMGNDTYRYGRVVSGSKNGTSRISASQGSTTNPSEDVGIGTGYYTYYADKDAIYPDTGSNSKYFPQTITYKWIAIWAPEA